MLGLRKKCVSNIFEYSAADALFIVAFFLFCLTNFFELTIWFYVDDAPSPMMGQIFKLVRYISYLLCVIKIIYDAYYDRKIFLYVAASFGAVLINMLVVDGKRLVFYMLIILAARNVSHDKIIKTFLLINIILLVLTVFSAGVGILEDVIQDETRNRHYLGFNWTTNGPIIFLFSSFCYIYIKRGKIRLIELLLMLVPIFYFYEMTDSRFVFLINIVSVLFFWLYGKKRFIDRLAFRLRKLFIISPFLISFFAILMHFFYNEDSSLWNDINLLLSNRLSLGKNAINEYGLSLFGKAIEWNVWEFKKDTVENYNFVDSSYLNVFLVNGLFVLILVLIIYSIIIKKGIDSKNYYIAWICVFILLFNVTEPRLIQLSYNPFVLLVLSNIPLCCDTKQKQEKSYSISLMGYKTKYII